MKRRTANEIADAAPTGRRERNKQEKKRRIVAAARELFATKGFAETTTQEITERADIGTGTLFLYARTKEDLLVMVFHDEMIETSQAAFRNAPAKGSLLDKAMHVFGRMVEYHDRDVALARALIREVTIPNGPERISDVHELMTVIYGGLRDLVEVAQAAGWIRADLASQNVAEGLFAFYYVHLVGWLGGRFGKAASLSRLRLALATYIDALGPIGAKRPVRARKAVPAKPRSLKTID